MEFFSRAPKMVDERALCGARNNADWYEAIFVTHGLKYHRSESVFVAEDEPPPYFSAWTVISPEVDDANLSDLAKRAGGSGRVMYLKDSFCHLSLDKMRFDVLFNASWIWRAPRQVTRPKGWAVIDDDRELRLWEDAWKRNGFPTRWNMFPKALLARDDVVFMGQKISDRFVAGCIANLSDDCVGFSNFFAETPSGGAYADAADAVTELGYGLPVVGYESGANLDLAHGAGFTSVGNLRVLVTGNAKL